MFRIISKSSSTLAKYNNGAMTMRANYSSLGEEMRLKTKLPIFRHDHEHNDHISIGKLKESDHSVALYNLEYITIDHIVNLTQEELNRLVVIPKAEKLSVEQRVEKLENDIKYIKESLDRLVPKKPTSL
ncbi:hypothetical protein CYY_000358 [Polysphondylium violaceum]|uniref:Uncharacterized protein n=1 Tax=Polysphondylium violaceum TaxID=133409 RepID=A0A8J4VBN4_9MYCE|nr:hypothetical protein CYY_000358 [Polysphondylium violaceum]